MKSLLHLLVLIAAAVLMQFVGAAHAQAVYKVVGPDGRVTYTNKEPGEVGKTTELEIKLSPISAASAATAASSPKSPASAASAVASAPKPAASGPKPSVVIYTASWCQYCKAAKAYLAQRKIPYSEVNTETLQGRLAFQKANGGTSSIPLIFVGTDKLQRGFSKSSYDTLFASY
jgi:glutaredoxin